MPSKNTLTTFGGSRLLRLAASLLLCMFVLAVGTQRAEAITGITVAPDLSSPQEAGNAITLTVTPTGATTPEYQFWRTGPGTTNQDWEIAQAYSASTTFVWTPTMAEIGTTTYRVWAREVGSTAVRDVRSVDLAYVVQQPDLASLLSRVSALETQNAALSAALTTAQGDITTLETDVTTLQGNSVLALDANLVKTTHNGLDVARFTGINVQIVDGSGTTVTSPVNGLGNLIVGYDEDAGPPVKTGSHNLIVGPEHTYASYGGVVFGQSNTSSATYATVLGGMSNTASGADSSVSGGSLNTASGTDSSVSGGTGNTASAADSSVSGGTGNTAGHANASVSGGATVTTTLNDQWRAGTLVE